MNNQGTELVYREVSCQKSVSGDDFIRGNQDYNFSMGSPSAWIPEKSYFRISMTITGAGGIQPTARQQIAFSDAAVNGLFNNIYAQAGGQNFSSATQFIAQTGAAKMRLKKSGAWLNSVGKSAYLCNSDFQERVNQVASDSNVLSKGDMERRFVGDANNQTTGTVAVTAATGIVTGVNTDLTQVLKGDVLVVDGIPLTATSNGTLLSVIVIPPLADIGATADAYIIKQTPKEGDGRNRIYAMWQPPIGLFDHYEPMGAGEYRISLNPNTNYKYAAVETKLGSSTTAIVPSSSTFDVTINDIRLYIATLKTSIPQGDTRLTLMESLVQSKPATGNTQQYEFTIPSSTESISVFVQSGNSGSNAIIPPTNFRCVDGSEKNLTSLQLTYANTTKPSTRWDSNYTTAINEMTQRYNDSLLESGLLMNSGGCETFDEWMNRGPLYHYSFERDADDKSTQLQLSTTFSSLEAGANIFVVSWYRKSTIITTSNGQVQAVRSLAV